MAIYDSSHPAGAHGIATYDSEGNPELYDPYAQFLKSVPGGKVDVPSGGNPTYYDASGQVMYGDPANPGTYLTKSEAAGNPNAVPLIGAVPSSSGFLGLSGSDIAQIGAMAGAAYGLGNFVAPTIAGTDVPLVGGATGAQGGATAGLAGEGAAGANAAMGIVPFPIGSPTIPGTNVPQVAGANQIPSGGGTSSGLVGEPSPAAAGPSPTTPVSPALSGGGGATAPGTTGGTIPTAGTTSGAAAGASTPGGSFVDGLIKQFKDNALGLGLIGASTLMANKSGSSTAGAPNLGELEKQISSLSGPAADTGKQLLAQYQSGALSPGQQASLDQLSQGTKNQLRQYFASIGQSNSTAAAQAEAAVDQQSLAIKQQMLDQALTNGLQAIGVASGPLSQVAQFQLGQDQQLRSAFGNFAGAIGNLFGRGTGASPTTSTTASPTISSTQATSPVATP